MSNKTEKKPGFGRVLWGIGLVCGFVYLAGKVSDDRSTSSSRSYNASPQVPAETYQLVHAIGNDENIAARGLSKRECESRKSELKGVGQALGTYNEKLGYGSITCLPESMF